MIITCTGKDITDYKKEFGKSHAGWKKRNYKELSIDLYVNHEYFNPDDHYLDPMNYDLKFTNHFVDWLIKRRLELNRYWKRR